MKRGFTIIELLVVAAIIIILAGIVLAMISTSRQRGQDAGMKEALHQVRNALEIYHVDKGNYPTPTPEFKLDPSDLAEYLPALPQVDYIYDTDCSAYGGTLSGSLLGNCFVLDAPIAESEGPNAGKCWRDDPLGVGIHDCYGL